MDGKDIKNDQLNMFENQIYYMNHLSVVISKIHTQLQQVGFRDRRHAERQTAMKNLEDKVSDVVSGVMAKGRHDFSDQEKEELKDEILRLMLIFSYKLLRIQMIHKLTFIHGHAVDVIELDSVKGTIESGKRIGRYLL
jgi:hypothetical protein